MYRIRSFLRHLKLLQLKYLRSHIVIGHNTKIDLKVEINNHTNKVVIGDNVYLRGVMRGYHAGMPFPTTILVDGVGADVFIGRNTRINGAYIHARKSIHIGDSCVIASGVNILDSNGHISHSDDRTIGRDEPISVEIGNNVWIGINAVILKGTKIGDNSIVGAGSVVKGVFQSNSIIVGNPAKVVNSLRINS